MSTASLSQWWDTLGTVDQVFWGIALFFSTLFLLQFTINLLGFGMDLDTDVDTDLDHEAHIDPGFTWLSVRGVIAFFTFFGWTGVLVLSEGGALWVALGLGFLAGMLAMALVGYLLVLFARQTQSGNYHIDDALYGTGEVYLPIPGRKEGSGKVHLLLGKGIRELEAVTEGKEIPTGRSVRVVGILDEHLLLVEEIRNETQPIN